MDEYVISLNGHHSSVTLIARFVLPSAERASCTISFLRIFKMPQIQITLNLTYFSSVHIFASFLLSLATPSEFPAKWRVIGFGDGRCQRARTRFISVKRALCWCRACCVSRALFVEDVSRNISPLMRTIECRTPSPCIWLIGHMPFHGAVCIILIWPFPLNGMKGKRFCVAGNKCHFEVFSTRKTSLT